MSSEQDRANIAKAQLIVRDIWETWYPGNAYTPAADLSSVLSQIFNSLWAVPEFSKTVDARIGAQNCITRAAAALAKGEGN